MNNYEFISCEHIKKIEKLRDYYWFCKIYCKELEEIQIKNFKDCNLKDKFPFILNENQVKKGYKNVKVKNFPLEWLKKNFLKDSFEIQSQIIQKAKIYSNLYEDFRELEKLINQHVPYSFGIWVKFELKQPYFSKDDEEFYLIQNPVLKEKVFKVPMIRGSGWKGAIAGAGKKIIEELYENGENKNGKDIWSYIFSYLKIFGTGNEDFRKLVYLIEKWKKGKKQKELKEKLLWYLLFELGVPLKPEDIEKSLEEILEKYFDSNFASLFDSKGEFNYYEAKKGRAIFYPTYFDRLSLEVINPHSRKRRAGINPIHYEVVPKGTEGILQIIYVPFDGILKRSEDLKKEVEKDLEFLCKCIERVADLGVGAKTKLSWGTFEIKDKKIFQNKNLSIPEGWENASQSE